MVDATLNGQSRKASEMATHADAIWKLSPHSSMSASARGTVIIDRFASAIAASCRIAKS